MLHFILGFYDPIYTSNGISSKDWAQMVGDMGAAALKMWMWFH